jgi:hypothetical protein
VHAWCDSTVFFLNIRLPDILSSLFFFFQKKSNGALFKFDLI